MTLLDAGPTGSSSTTTPTTARAVEATTRSRVWAVSGLGAGLAIAGALGAQGAGLGAAYDADISGDATAIAAEIHDHVAVAAAFHVLLTLGAVLLVPFALGLARRLRGSVPSGSLLPQVAGAGLLATAAVLVLAGGLDTEFGVFGGEAGEIPAEHISFYSHWTGTIPCLWVLAGLTAVSTAMAARHGAVSRWHAWLGFGLGGLTLALGISPFEYMALLPALLWLLFAGVALTVGDRQHRRG